VVLDGLSEEAVSLAARSVLHAHKHSFLAALAARGGGGGGGGGGAGRGAGVGEVAWEGIARVQCIVTTEVFPVEMERQKGLLVESLSLPPLCDRERRALRGVWEDALISRSAV